MSVMRVAIVGSRDFTNYDIFCKIVSQFLSEWNIDVIEVVSGGARGTDLLAERWAKEHGVSLKVFPADWNKWGLSAGPRRNSQIVDYCTHVIAFPSRFGKGTQDTVQKAQVVGKPTKIYFID